MNRDQTTGAMLDRMLGDIPEGWYLKSIRQVPGGLGVRYAVCIVLGRHRDANEVTAFEATAEFAWNKVIRYATHDGG